MTNKATLEEIEALAKGATPGPWKTVIPNPEEGWIDVVTEEGNPVVGDQGVYNGPELEPTVALIASAPRLLEIAQEQAAEIARLKQCTCEACADADSCDRVGRAANRQCAAFRVVTKK
jgi:hypothetical protein